MTGGLAIDQDLMLLGLGAEKTEPIGYSVLSIILEATMVDQLSRPKDQMEIYWFSEQAQGYIDEKQI